MRKNFKFKIAAVCGLLAILIGLTGCANNNSNKITVVGSSAMQLVAVVGIVPIVNKSAGVSNLSKQQLSDIFTGKITNWKQVGGKNQTITVINRSKGSGTRGTFEGLVLNGKKPIQAQEQDSNGTVRKIVT